MRNACPFDSFTANKLPLFKHLKVPSPLAIALSLSLFVFVLALFTTDSEVSTGARSVELLDIWYHGFWGLLAFTMQMVLILVLGHMIALSHWVEQFVFWFIKQLGTGATAIAAVALATLLLSFFNWGLGLVFGAVLARKMGEYASQKEAILNYPLVGAAGYCGLMFWHGGISGSAPLTVAKEGHFLSEKIGVIGVGETIFSTQNLLISLAVVICIPLLFYWMSIRKPSDSLESYKLDREDKNTNRKGLSYLMLVFGLVMLGISIWQLVKSAIETGSALNALNLDSINFLLYGLALIFISNITSFERALDEASRSAAGILVQFPLYAGIMAVMKESGLMEDIAATLISFANADTYPIITFFSAAVVNVMVPSGGGQWAVQGPIVVESASQIGTSLTRNIMALAYGDQLTNMIQPFWALPLLGITGIPASKLLPYSFKVMIAGMIIYLIGLLLW